MSTVYTFRQFNYPDDRYKIMTLMDKLKRELGDDNYYKIESIVADFIDTFEPTISEERLEEIQEASYEEGYETGFSEAGCEHEECECECVECSCSCCRRLRE